MKPVVDAIDNKQFIAAEELISAALQEKINNAMVERKHEVANIFGQNIDEEKKDYEAFFEKAMKKFGISSPADLKTDEKKKEFFNYVDKNFKAKNEEYIEESVNKIKDLPINQTVIDSIKKGDQVEIETEQIKYTGKSVTKREVYKVSSIKTKDDMTRISLASPIATYTIHYDRRRGVAAFTLGDHRLVVTGIRKK